MVFQPLHVKLLIAPSALLAARYGNRGDTWLLAKLDDSPSFAARLW